MLVADQTERLVEWYVVFNDKEAKRGFMWWDLFTKRGFRHCYVFGRWDADWVKIEFLRCWTQVDVVRQSELVKNGYQDYAEFLRKVDGARVLRVTRWLPVRTIPFILPINCVSVVKSLLGLKSWVFTPQGLYEKLMDMPNVTVIQ